MKKYLLYLLIVSFLFGTEAISQWRPDGVPGYLRADFFEKFPDFYRFPINGRIKYYEPTAEDLKSVPEQTKFLNSDGIEVVNLSSSFLNAKTETWMAINPLNPANLIATSNDNAFLGGFQGFRMTAFVTKDGAKTWSHKPTPANSGQWFTPTGTQATIFDPAIAFDTKGHVYYAYGFSETSWGNEEKDTEKNGVFVVKSTNGGDTWDGLTDHGPNGIVAITTDAFKNSGNPFHDRYTLSVDLSETSPYKDNIYIAWRVFRGLDGIVISKSSNGGETWSPYRRLAIGGQAPQPMTGPNGELYVTWIDVDWNGFSKAMFIKSTDAGNSFGSPMEVQRVASIGTRHPVSGRNTLTTKQGIRVSSVPQLAIDNSNSPYRGTVYVVQAGRESATGPYGIYLAKSTNEGATWVKNQRIDNSTIRNDMFFPSISVDPKTGMVSVLYYSSQNDPNNVGVDAYVAISNDGGTTWQHLRVSPNTIFLNSPNTVMAQGGDGNVYWGDYTHIVSFDNKVYPLYWMPSAANYSYYSNAMFTAFISPAPQQPLNASFTTLVSPTSVKLSWTHPTKNLLGQNLNDFKINVYKGENKIGEVAKSQTPEFTDSDVVYGNQYVYYLETEATDGLKSARTEVRALIGGNPKPKAPRNFSWKPTPDGISFSWTNPSQSILDEPFMDDLKIAFYDASTNQLIEKYGSAEFIAGNGATYNLKVDTEKFYEIKFKAIGVRGDVETESDFADDVIIAYAGSPKSELTENFDNESSRLPYYTNGKWNITTSKAASAPNAFNDSPGGNYSANSLEYFLLPPVVLSTEKSTLNFEHIALIDTVVRTDVNGNPTYDFGEIAYSRDFGKTWQMLKWVNVGTSENFFIGNLAGSDWQNLAFNLSQFTGDTVMFRFTLGSNDFRHAEGWFIDNISMDNKPSSVNYDLLEMSMIAVSPNPVRNSARVALKTAIDADVKIELFDVLGNKIETRNAGLLSQGNHIFDFNMSELSDGMYYYRVNIGNYTKTLPVSVTK